MVKVNKWDRPCYKCRSHFCDLSCKEILQPKQQQEFTSCFFSREAMKEHSDFHPQPKAEQDKPAIDTTPSQPAIDTTPQPKQEEQEPVALVTGVYGGRFTYAPIKASVILPVGTALYTHPQPREWKDLTDEELETLLRENRTLTLGSIWAVEDKLRSKNGY